MHVTASVQHMLAAKNIKVLSLSFHQLRMQPPQEKIVTLTPKTFIHMEPRD